MSDEASERGPNYNWKIEAAHYRLECDKLRALLGKVETSSEQHIYDLRSQLADEKENREYDRGHWLDCMVQLGQSQAMVKHLEDALKDIEYFSRPVGFNSLLLDAIGEKCLKALTPSSPMQEKELSPSVIITRKELAKAWAEEVVGYSVGELTDYTGTIYDSAFNDLCKAIGLKEGV